MIDLDAFKSVNAMVIGDLMIDEYLWGSVDRISPEAPVPVVSVEKEESTLGGAGNVINNLVAMGAGVTAIGTAGNGRSGRMIFEKLESLGIATDGVIYETDRPTTRKTRVIASSQQVLRIDREIKKDINAGTLEKLAAAIEQKLPGTHLIIISDYDKGLVTRALVERTVFLAQKTGTLVLADPKALDFSKYKNVHLLTPNKKEASLAANVDIKSQADILSAGEKIMKQVCLDRLLITCGKDGMVLFERNEKPYTIASKARQVFDVSGAGDTVISLLGLCLVAGAGFRQSAAVANAAAGIVVGKIGTAAATLDELRQALADQGAL